MCKILDVGRVLYVMVPDLEFDMIDSLFEAFGGVISCSSEGEISYLEG